MRRSTVLSLPLQLVFPGKVLYAYVESKVVLSLGTSDFDLNVVLFKENVSAIKKYGLLLRLKILAHSLEVSKKKVTSVSDTYLETSGSKSSYLYFKVVHF